jgi:RNA polymerase sigma factor (sigma-70 family)
VREVELRLKELMLQSLGGDAGAYRTLLEELSSLLRIYYRRRLGAGNADTEDLVQETLIAVHTRRASFDTSQPFTGWAYAIARYKLVDFLRRRRWGELIPAEDCDELFAPDDVEQVSAAVDVNRLLSKLPAPVGEAIRLTRVEGLSVEETAQRTGKSVAAVKVSIHRGLMRLLQKQGGKPDADG